MIAVESTQHCETLSVVEVASPADSVDDVVHIHKKNDDFFVHKMPPK